MRAFWILFLGLALAQGGLGIRPAYAEYRVLPGERVQGTFTVFTGKAPLQATVELYDWRSLPNGELELLPAGSTARSLAPLIQLSQKRIDTEQTSADVYYSFTLPPDAEGSYHVGLLVRPVHTQVETGPGRLKLRSLVALFVPIYAVAKGTEIPRLVLLSSRRTPAGYELVIQNQGNVYLPVKAKVEALDRAGKVRLTYQLLQADLLPGELRKIVYTPDALPAEIVLLRFIVTARGIAPLVWEANP